MKKPTDEEILKRYQERLPACVSYWAEHHEKFKANKSFSRCTSEYGQWDEEEYLARTSGDKPRITLTENLLGPFNFQVANDLKQSDFGVAVLPKDSGTDVETAEVRAGLHRGIQEIGGFRNALNQAIEDLIDGGIGAFRFITRQRNPGTFRKEIEYCELDPTHVFHGDGTHRKSDFSDVDDSFIYEPMSKDRFKAEFKIDPSSADTFTEATPLWGSPDTPWVIEYFFRVRKPAKIALTIDEREAYLDDLEEEIADPKGKIYQHQAFAHLAGMGVLTVDDIIARDEDGEPIIEDSERCQVIYARLAGGKVLESQVWPGYFIPVFIAHGRKVTIDGKTRYYSLSEPAHDVQRAHNYAFSALVERAGKAPKVRYFMPVEGMDPAYASVYKNLPDHDGVVPYLSIDKVTSRDLQKPYQEPPIQSDPAFINLRMMTLQGIRDVLGMWETSLGAQSKEKSGVAIQARERQSDTGNADWGINLAKAAELCFRATDEIINKIYDIPTQVRIVGEDDQEKVITVASMTGDAGYAGQYFDLNTGKYDILCRMSPSADTKREEQSRGLEMIFGQSPELKMALAPEYIALQDWKNAKKMAKVAKAVRAAMMPGVNFGDEEGQTPQIPPQVAQQMQQMQMQMQQMQAALQQIGPENERLKLENAAIKADRANDTRRVQIEEFKAQVEARAKQVDLSLKGDQQEHTQAVDRANVRMKAAETMHKRQKDAAELGIKADGQDAQRRKDEMSLAQADRKMSLDAEKAKASPTGGKPGKSSNRGR